MTNRTNRIGKATEEGCDGDGGKWVIICLIHAMIFNTDTKKSAIFLSQNLCADQCSAFISQEADDTIPEEWQSYGGGNPPLNRC